MQNSLWICKEKNLFFLKANSNSKITNLVLSSCSLCQSHIWSTIWGWLYISSTISNLVSSCYCSVRLGINGLQDLCIHNSAHSTSFAHLPEPSQLPTKSSDYYYYYMSLHKTDIWLSLFFTSLFITSSLPPPFLCKKNLFKWELVIFHST